jgi:RND family efflux transporter MFP subunit
MNRTKSIIVGVAIVSLGVVAIAVMMASKPKPPKKPPVISAPLVDVIVPKVEDVQFQIKAHGLVQPRTETVLVSEVSGIVVSVSDKFVAGGLFNQGEVILQIDPSDYEVAVEQAKARLASQKAKYAQEKAKAEQAKQEWDLTGRSRDNAPILALREPFLQEAKANMQSAEADLKKAEQKLARTIIRAPYQGIVKSKKVDIGQFVSVGTQLGDTFAIDYAEVRLALTDNELAYIDLPVWGGELSGIKPKVELSASYAGQQVIWSAEIVRMEGVVDNQSRVHYAVARVTDPYAIASSNNSAAPLKVGTFVSAKIEGKKMANLIKLPRDAFRDLNRVLISNKDNQLYLRELSVVRSEANYVYVKAGLDIGDRVVLTALESPVEGMTVRISSDNESFDANKLKPQSDVAENN